MRIAFCQPDFEPLRQVARGESADAACIQQWYIAEGLRNLGHGLTYVAPSGLDRVVCTTDPGTAREVTPTWSASRWFHAARRAAWRVQRATGVPYLNVFSNYVRLDACLRCLPGHDIAIERNGLYNAGVAMACRRLALPYVVFFDADQIAEHDFMGTPITGLLRWRAKRLLRYNLVAADAVICVSEAAKDRLTSAWGVPASKIQVFPNAVDVERFRPSNTARAEVRAAVGLGAEPVVIFVGGFYKWHDLFTLVDAFALARRSAPAARLLLVGDGPERGNVERHVSDRGLASMVTFTGAVAHAKVPEFIAAADIGVAPVPKMTSDSWLSPMKVFEYMASGVAVVASRTGQAATVIEDGANGLLVPAGEAEALAAALSRLMADTPLCARLGTLARKHAVERHSWGQYLERLDSLLSALAPRE